MSSYGASPWYTEDIIIGGKSLRLSLDTGANFIWVTVDACKTKACSTHNKVQLENCTLASFNGESLHEKSFGPWGTIKILFAETTMHRGLEKNHDIVRLFLAMEYNGDQFQYLSWDGAIGLPSESNEIEENSDFYIEYFLKKGLIKEPIMSVYTDRTTGRGTFIIGGTNPNLYDINSELILSPKKYNGAKFLWGTELFEANLGNTALPNLSGSYFFLDTGSSEFKAADHYMTPILNYFYALTTENGERIFTKLYDKEKEFVGLFYNEGFEPSTVSACLPDFSLTLGRLKHNNEPATVALSPEQYSQYITSGPDKGKWMLMFKRLDGFEGLLVGSTFMDHFYTVYTYDTTQDNLVQGDMMLYKKR